jgi:chromate transporter
MFLVLVLAWAYGRYGSTSQVGAILHGIKPVIIAVIVQAIYALLPTAVKTWRLGLVVALSAALYLLGFNPLIPLFGLSILVMLAENRARLARTAGKGRMVLAVPLTAAAAPVAVGAVGFSLVVLFLTFLKIGATLYGSGYVLLAFLRDDFVHRLGWLTDRQLLDAIAVGQFTPGPVFTTATFIGYLTGAGWGGSSLRWVSSCPRSSLGQQSIPLCRACERRRGRRPFWMGQMPPRSASWWQWLGNSRGAASLIRSPPS